MIDIALAAVPNQSLSVQLNEQQYDLHFRDLGDCMAVSVERGGEFIIRGARLLPGVPVLPYRYQEEGNFLMLTEGDALPYFDQFGVTQFLVYMTQDEIDALRAA